MPRPADPPGRSWSCLSRARRQRGGVLWPGHSAAATIARMEEHFRTSSPVETVRLGKKLARRFGRGDCLALVGQLGAGKTVLVRGIAAGMGLADRRLVASPTFVLVAEYPTDPPIFHVDLYRPRNASRELPGLGLEEMLAHGVVVIEWADRAGDALPRPRWQVDIAVTGRSSRRLTLRRID